MLLRSLGDSVQPDSAKVELHALPRAAFNDGELNHNMAQGLCLQPARSAEDCFVKHQWPTNMLTTYSRTAALIPSRLCGQLGVHVITLADHQECPITKCYNHKKLPKTHIRTISLWHMLLTHRLGMEVQHGSLAALQPALPTVVYKSRANYNVRRSCSTGQASRQQMPTSCVSLARCDRPRRSDGGIQCAWQLNFSAGVSER